MWSKRNDNSVKKIETDHFKKSNKRKNKPDYDKPKKKDKAVKSSSEKNEKAKQTEPVKHRADEKRHRRLDKEDRHQQMKEKELTKNSGKSIPKIEKTNEKYILADKALEERRNAHEMKDKIKPAEIVKETKKKDEKTTSSSTSTEKFYMKPSNTHENGRQKKKKIYRDSARPNEILTRDKKAKRKGASTQTARSPILPSSISLSAHAPVNIGPPRSSYSVLNDMMLAQHSPDRWKKDEIKPKVKTSRARDLHQKKSALTINQRETSRKSAANEFLSIDAMSAKKNKVKEGKRRMRTLGRVIGGPIKKLSILSGNTKNSFVEKKATKARSQNKRLGEIELKKNKGKRTKSSDGEHRTRAKRKETAQLETHRHRTGEKRHERHAERKKKAQEQLSTVIKKLSVAKRDAKEEKHKDKRDGSEPKKKSSDKKAHRKSRREVASKAEKHYHRMENKDYHHRRHDDEDLHAHKKKHQVEVSKTSEFENEKRKHRAAEKEKEVAVKSSSEKKDDGRTKLNVSVEPERRHRVKKKHFNLDKEDKHWQIKKDLTEDSSKSTSKTEKEGKKKDEKKNHEDEYSDSKEKKGKRTKSSFEKKKVKQKESPALEKRSHLVEVKHRHRKHDKDCLHEQLKRMKQPAVEDSKKLTSEKKTTERNLLADTAKHAREREKKDKGLRRKASKDRRRVRSRSSLLPNSTILSDSQKSKMPSHSASRRITSEKEKSKLNVSCSSSTTQPESHYKSSTKIGSIDAKKVEKMKRSTSCNICSSNSASISESSKFRPIRKRTRCVYVRTSTPGKNGRCWRRKIKLSLMIRTAGRPIQVKRLGTYVIYGK